MIFLSLFVVYVGMFINLLDFVFNVCRSNVMEFKILFFFVLVVVFGLFFIEVVFDLVEENKVKEFFVKYNKIIL